MMVGSRFFSSKIKIVLPKNDSALTIKNPSGKPRLVIRVHLLITFFTVFLANQEKLLNWENKALAVDI
jgi:hypothetical protein